VTAIFAGDETGDEGGEGGATSESAEAPDALAIADPPRRSQLSVATKSAAAAKAAAATEAAAVASLRADLRVAAVAVAASAAVSAAVAEKAAAEKAAAAAEKAAAAASARAAERRRQADLLTAKSAAAAEAAAAAVAATDLAAASAAAPAAVSAAAGSGHGGGERVDHPSGGPLPRAARSGPLAGRLSHPQPFFNYPRADAESSGLPSAPSSVFHHIFGAVIDWFSSEFSAEGLPVPRLWSDVSDGHLKLMHSTMADLHSKADERNVDFSKLPVDRSSWDRFLDNTMLNDECVDWMAKMLCQAVGSTMPGAETETVSPMLEISANHSGRYVVLGVLHAEMLRRLGRSEDLTPVLRTLVGKGNVREVLARRLDPLRSKDLLVLQTRGKHTSLVELTRSRSSVDGGWSLCIHDTSNADPTLDSDLNRGINLLLNATSPERAGAKTGTRLPRKYPVYIQQKDSTVCGLTTFINLVQKLTGEVLDPHYWPLFVDLVRLFFDIWIQTWIPIHPGNCPAVAPSAAGPETRSPFAFLAGTASGGGGGRDPDAAAGPSAGEI